MSDFNKKALAWAKNWARERGWWNGHNGADVLLMGDWSVRIEDGLVEVATSKHALPGRVVELWRLPPLDFRVFAAAVDTGRTVRRVCPACEGAKVESVDVECSPHGVWNSATLPCGFRALSGLSVGTLEFQLRDTGWSTERVGTPAHPRPEVFFVRASRPCPTCSAKGRLDVPLGQLVCEAMPVMWDGEAGAEELHPGDPTARIALLAAAYGVDPGVTDGERAKTCETCNGTREGVTPLPAGQWDGAEVLVEDNACPDCSDPEPSEAQVLRDYLHEQGVTVVDRTLALAPELLASFPTPPATEFGRLLLAWLSGAPCEGCDWTVETDAEGYKRAKHGSGYVECKAPAPAGWPSDDFGAERAPSSEIRLIKCPSCGGHGTAYAALAIASIAL